MLAAEFDVSYDDVANIPTLAQAGYAVGLIFLCPMGDIVKRRPFTLILIATTATAWTGLCVTRSLHAFIGLSFLTGLTTVTPQIMLPLIAELAPPNRRAAAMSICGAGLMAGILFARIMSGVLTDATSWRTVYYFALGLQWAVFGALWWFLPDYPRVNSGLAYTAMLRSIVRMLLTEPLLVQMGLMTCLSSMAFTDYWSTLSFLLSAAPYGYDSAVIGLFGLCGLFTICVGVVWGQVVTDRYVPLFSIIVCTTCGLVGAVVGTYAGPYSVAGPIVQALLQDFGMSASAVAARNAIYCIDPHAKNRINTAYMLATFVGQMTGTVAGARLYTTYTGGAPRWYASGSLGVAALATAVCVGFARGPYEDRWVGWGGGLGFRKKDKGTADGRPRVKQEVDLHGNGVRDLQGEKDTLPARPTEEAHGIGALVPPGDDDDADLEKSVVKSSFERAGHK